MLSRTPCLAALSCFLTFLGAVRAADVELQVVRFPERRDVELPMLSAGRIPGALMQAKVKFEEGQSRIEISYDEMKPAVLFGGDVTSYVLWAINRDGAAENLGELWVRPDEDKDTLRFSTGLRTFALMITGEPYYQVSQPSAMVIFQNARSVDPQAPSDRLLFTGLGPAPAHGMQTLAAVRYDSRTVLDVVQAEKAFELAGSLDAAEHAPDVYREASISLQQSQAMARNAVSRKGAQEWARKSFASSNEAIKIAVRRRDEIALEQRIAQRRAEIQALEQRAAEAEEQARRLQMEAQAKIASLENQRQQAEATISSLAGEKERSERELQRISRERAQMESQRTALESALGDLRREQAELSSSLQSLQSEKSLLEGRLQQALSQVAETRETARGFVVSLPDILFSVGQASLKPEAQIVIAKLAGILLILQDLNLRIEGHTDSTGSASLNLRLSQERADAVFDFLAGQGIPSARMTTMGYGLERPIADNATAAGRQKNRRVEIFIGEE